MKTNHKQTSQNVASLASDTLRNKNASNIGKQLAASALSQTGTPKQTGSHMENIASKALSSSKYSSDTKTLAASVLSQANKAR